ncbi:RluA family pseudouridine synthase [Candidatus Poribacteria bacterium]|nr:RluA family pseudouridine synthase [Candidatus Poribacteria bacterium]
MGEMRVSLYTVGEAESGLRVDRFLSEKEGISREFAKKLIHNGHVSIDGHPTKPSHRVRSGERIRLEIPPPEPLDLRPERMELDLIYQDDHLIVLNKPPGIAVHPGAGVRSGTLVNALLGMFPDLPGIGGAERPGIVHRLDKDTSGVMVVAKSDLAHRDLIEQFRRREVRKRYLALICGVPHDISFVIDAPIGRSIHDRKKFSVNSVSPKEAITEVRILEDYGRYALIEARPKTGRTHQIRVHLSHIGHPVVGDPMYGGGRKRSIKEAPDEEIRKVMERITRQMLHAHTLSFRHPATGKWMSFSAPIPEDMKEVIERLRRKMN